MNEEKKLNSEKQLKDSNNYALLGFIFSLLGCMALPGLVLSIIGLIHAKEYKKGRKKLAIAGIVISSVILLFSFGIIFSEDSEKNNSSNNNKNVIEKKKSVEVVDFSSMTKASIDSWCETNRIVCTYGEEYSDIVENGNYIRQSISSGQKVYEGEKIIIIYSLGKKPTISQTNALNKALSYLRVSSFSYNSLVEQLEFEKFSHEDAVYGVEHCGADWNEQAVKKAQSYLKVSSFSRDGLIEQLEFEGFTYEQAVYGVTQNGL